MDLGKHALFIWLCYGVVAAVVALMILGLWLDGRRQRRELARLDARGIRRDTTATPDPTST